MHKFQKGMAILLVLIMIASGGFAAWRMLQKKGTDPVVVYGFDLVGMTEYWGDTRESYGPVSTDRIQTIFLSDTQTVSEIAVEEGQEVAEGDLLMRFDTTLSELELERKDLEIQKTRLDLEDEQQHLREINAMVPKSSPPPEKETKPTEPVEPDKTFGINRYPGKDGLSAETAYVYWAREEEAIDFKEIGLQYFRIKTPKPDPEQPTEEETEPTEGTEQEIPQLAAFDKKLTGAELLFLLSEDGEDEEPTEPATEPQTKPTEAPTNPPTEPPTEPHTDPPKPAEETEPSKPQEEQEPSQAATEPDPSDPTEESSEPSDPTEESSEPSDPTEESSEPTEESTEPSDPTDPSEEETDPTDPSETDPTDPSDETDPTDPEETDPTDPDDEEGDEDEDEDEEGEFRDYYIIVKVMGGNLMYGDRMAWLGFHVLSDGTIRLFDASSTEDYTYVELPPVPTKPYVDYFGSGYTRAEIARMRDESTRKIIELELAIKVAEAEYKIMERELSDGNIYAEIDGKVVSVLTEEAAKLDQLPVIKVSGGGGFFVEGSVSELEREYMTIGQEVTVNEWDTGMSYSGKITAVGDYPTAGSSSNGMDNPNASSYPFTVFVNEDADLKAGGYVSIQYAAGSDQSGIYLQKPFVRTVKGRDFVYLRGEDGNLEERTITTGKSVWGSYVEVLGGIDTDDLIAFPYGKNIRPGVPTRVGDLNDLYG